MVDVEPLLGQIQLFPLNFAPRGWAFCEGQLLAIAQNAALFSLLGTMYGGDGRTTFGLPDLRGRAALHEGQGPGLSNYPLASKRGADAALLNAAQLPSHEHSVQPACDDVDQTAAAPKDNAYGADPSGLPTGIYSNATNATMAAFESEFAGGGQPVNRVQPSLGLQFCIALQGIFPSRN